VASAIGASASVGCVEDPHADPTAVDIYCSQQTQASQEAQTSLDVAAWRDTEGRIDQTAYEYLWLPSCPGALPSSGQFSSDIDCVAAHDCNDATLISMSLWANQTSDNKGLPIRNAGWSYLGSECRDPQEEGPVAQRQALTTQDVISAVRRVGVPAATVEGPQYTLVNLETTFFTRPQTIDRSLTIIGYTVDVQVDPSSYQWNWGDGTTTTSRTAGQPYPSKDVTHAYLHASDEGAALALSVDVTYAARYRVDGGPWQTIPDVMTIAGPPTELPVKQATAVLVAE